MAEEAVMTLEERLQALEEKYDQIQDEMSRLRHRQAKGAFILLNSVPMPKNERVQFARRLLEGTKVKLVGEVE